MRARLTFIIATAALAVALGACKKSDKGGGETNKPPKKNPCAGKTENPCAGETQNPCAGKGLPDPMGHVPTDPTANFAVAKISHAEPKPTDPVLVVFNKIEIKSVEMKDPADLTGATAEIHIALGELDSGVPARDKDLKSPSYFDAAKNPTAVVKVSDVKKAGDGKYNALATVEAMGVTQQWPVSFEVVETKGASVRIKGSHKFKRSDFKIGAGQGGPADELELELQLTLENT